ncbi:hypothetical protein ZWY2020_017338 [Hordeum vulgare]|nr:hypothetical protein ZWY2020_017338 [Hordeum vulgare]
MLAGWGDTPRWPRRSRRGRWPASVVAVATFPPWGSAARVREHGTERTRVTACHANSPRNTVSPADGPTGIDDDAQARHARATCRRRGRSAG